jgi:bifunctional DNA-binding transcriptional regulator/antitoxin component of YhaV-PrlF toxin-antitoxin module
LARGQVTLPKEIRREAFVEPGDTVMFRVTGPGTVKVKVLPRLTLREALEHYQIEGTVDLEADRAQWQEKAAGEVIAANDD